MVSVSIHRHGPRGEGEGKGEEAIGGKGIRMKKRGEGGDREVARNGEKNKGGERRNKMEKEGEEANESRK